MNREVKLEQEKLDYQSPSLPASPLRTGPALARNMGLFTLIVYGVGDMVGSGIYGTVGRAASELGNAVWLGFIASMVAALLTGLSYASIASRYPRAAGAAYVTHRAFHIPFLSYMVGLTVTASGLTSMATASNVFAATLYNNFFDALPVKAIIVLFLVVIAFVNFWGIRESMWLNLLCTAVEVGGLIFVIAVGMRYWGDVNYLETASGRPLASLSGTLMILNGAVLTFYSFVGFEDMLNVGEEVKNPQRNMPWGILIALLIATLLYICVSVTAVSVVDYRRLGVEAHGAAMTQVTNRAAPWLPVWVFTAITLFAVANTALINYIMGSRLVYGMAQQRLVPAMLGCVHEKRCTPYMSILVLAVIVLALALAGDISQLASATSLLLLGCFTLINASLIVLKNRADEPHGHFEIPSIIPLLGSLCCLGLIVNRMFPKDGKAFEWKAPAIAAGLAAGIALLYLIMRPRNITEESLAHLDDEV